jgi:NADH-quinone oxidoreductase subunit A
MRLRVSGPPDTLELCICEFFHEVRALPKSDLVVPAAFAMLRSYLPVLLLLAFVLLNAVLILGIAHLTVKPQPTPVKTTQPYESGISPLGDARERFSVKFYLVAMLFIVFDIETVFMIPWGVQYRQLSCAVPLVSGACPAGQISFFGFGEMLVFALILLVGYLYVWKKGALTWD